MGVSQVEVGQSFEVRVVIQQMAPMGRPTFPENPNVDVQYRHQSTKIESNLLGGLQRRYVYTYRVTPRVAGEVVVGPFEASFRNRKTLSTQPLTFTALERGSIELPEEPVMVRGEFDVETAWEGQVVHYTAQLTAQVPIRNHEWISSPFDALTPPPGSMPARSQSTIEDPRGPITMARRLTPLMATKAGTWKQAPLAARVEVLTGQQSLFGRRARVTSVVADTRTSIRVRPLPLPPANFSGLVGTFGMRSKLATQQAVVGESVAWTVQVAGEGVVDGHALDVPSLTGAQVYQDKAEDTGRVQNGRYVSGKTHQITLVPTEPGTLEIPPIELVVFDTTLGAYKTLRTEPSTLTVTGEAADVEMTVFGRPNEIIENAPIELAGMYTWGLATAAPITPLWVMLLGVVSFPAGLLLVGEGGAHMRGWWGRRRESSRSSIRGARRLKQLPDDPHQRLSVLDLALREALADAANVDVGKMNRSESMDALDVDEAVREAFRTLDRIRFAGGGAEADLVESVTAAIRSLRG